MLRSIASVRILSVPFRSLVPAALSLLLTGCGVGQTGDGCWSDDDCASGSCTFSTCDASFLELLRDDSPEEVRSEPSYTPPPSVQEPRCAIFDEATCRATPRCTFTSTCSMSLGCLAEPGATVATCAACMSDPTCPSPCQAWGSCGG